MTTTELVQDVKARLVEELTALEATTRRVDTLMDALNRSHRCWPSRWGWTLAGLLAVYIILEVSFHVTNHLHENEVRVLQKTVTTLQQELATTKHFAEHHYHPSNHPPTQKLVVPDGKLP